MAVIANLLSPANTDGLEQLTGHVRHQMIRFIIAQDRMEKALRVFHLRALRFNLLP